MVGSTKGVGRLCAAAALALFIGRADATLYQIDIDTSAFSGVSGAVAFDLIDGNSTNDSSVTISSFSVTAPGALGSSTLTGGASGTPPDVTLSDTTFFNEYLQFLTFGSSLTFTFGVTGNLGPTPDAFSFVILDGTSSNGGNYLVTSDDPGLTNTLVFYNIGATSPPYPPQPEIYQGCYVTDTQDCPNVGVVSTRISETNGAPEPGTLALALASLLALGGLRSATMHRHGARNAI